MAKPTWEELLVLAKEKGASDIHITVGVPPKMRINGHLETLDQYERLMPPDTEALANEIMDNDPKKLERFEREREYDFSIGRQNLGRYRVNAFHQRGSAALSLRVVSTEIPDPIALGVPTSVIDLYDRRRGLILVTGPTGSGKSTTLAAIIDKINKNRDAHIITLEDPIEYMHRHNMSIVNQREIGLDSNSYNDALRAALREDPDVILVGEMRDYETISIAITAAETGHLVLSTLHTNDAVSVVSRLENMGIEPFLIGSVLKGAIAQRLVRKLSKEQNLTKAGAPVFSGRIIISETFSMTPELETLIQNQVSKNELIEYLKTQNMIFMKDDAVEKIQAGLTTRQEAEREILF